MSERWVVNASPLITLAKVGQLSLLTDLAGEVIIPAPVAHEILEGPAGDPARKALEAGWGHRAGSPVVPAEVLEWGLGAGESSVLAWALANQPSTVVLDDGEARACARTLKVRLIGTLGVVLRAQRKGKIERAAPVLSALRAVGLRLDDAVVREALKSATGEDWKG